MNDLSAAHPTESRALLAVALATWLTYGAAFAYVCVDHVRYPGFVEPMEGSALHHVERFADGLTPYPAPQSDFIGLSYMPLYYVAAVPFYRWFGDSFEGPRLLSVLAAFASGGLVSWIAWRETRSRTGACLAGALYFASYRIMDAWLTCALPDSLLLFWILLGYCFWAYGTKARHDVAWLVCFTLAFWTKQHGALFFGFAVLHALLFRRHRLLFRTHGLPRWALVAGLLTGGPVSFVLLGPLFGEGFFHLTLDVPGGWDRSAWLSARRTAFVLVEFVPFAGALTLWYWIRSLRRRPAEFPPLAWFSATSLAAIAATMMASGSSNNHFVPFLAIACVTATISLLQIAEEGPPRGTIPVLGCVVLLSTVVTVLAVRSFADHPIPKFVPAVATVVLLAVLAAGVVRRAGSRRAAVVAVVLLLGQLGCDFYWLPDFVAGRDSGAAFSALGQELSALDGPVIWYPYGYVPQEATGARLAVAPSAIEYEDVQRHSDDPDENRRDTGPFRRRLVESDPLYVLSAEELDHVPGLPDLPQRWELVRDYGDRFAGVRQVTIHWYGGGQHPRYLYRGRPAHFAGDPSAAHGPGGADGATGSDGLRGGEDPERRPAAGSGSAAHRIGVPDRLPGAERIAVSRGGSASP